MSLKAQATYALGRVRWFTDQILAAFSGDDWFYQPQPKVNFPLWIAGHLGLADNMFASRFREDTAAKPDGWDDLFWFGSELKDHGAYPATDEVLSYFRDRRENLMKVLEDVTDDELNAPAPPPEERSPIAGAPCIGHIFLFAAQHEWMHCGQLTVAHRSLGHPPVIS